MEHATHPHAAQTACPHNRGGPLAAPATPMFRAVTEGAGTAAGRGRQYWMNNWMNYWMKIRMSLPSCSSARVLGGVVGWAQAWWDAPQGKRVDAESPEAPA